MKIIVSTLAGTLGPFVEVTEHEGHIEADDAIYPRTVIGSATVEDQGDWQPPAPPPVVPASVTMRQARLALLAAGKLSAVDTAINALSSPAKEAARIEWDYAQEVRRDWPLVNALAPAIGLDDAALDALFIAAESM